MYRSCILLVIVVMMFPCCNAIDQVKLSKTKTQNPVRTTNINDRDGYRYLRSYKTEEEADDATDNEERAWGLDSLKSLLHIKKTPNDFSKTILERMDIDSRLKGEMFSKWRWFYTNDKVKSKLIKKDPAMLLDFMNGNTAVRPRITD
ncbi:hypothetical protein KRP22_014705 [Phytophthora ramorum]|nr:hypothetical protein KRP22_14481 [Phytophthora ramorum]